MDLKKYIRDIPDFPKPGIIFKDLSPLYQNAEVLAFLVQEFYVRYKDQEISQVVGIEARGFPLAAILAEKLGAGFVMLRKPGKLPYQTHAVEYALEYGTDRLEIHTDAVDKNDRVLIVDDLLATGGTMRAACQLLEKCEAEIVELAFIVNLRFLKGFEQLESYPLFNLLSYQ